jgi:hypothetical protein
MISDRELREIEYAGSISPFGLALGMWARIFGVMLDRPVSSEEAADAIQRINRRAGPPEPGTTYADLTHSNETTWKGTL